MKTINKNGKRILFRARCPYCNKVLYTLRRYKESDSLLEESVLESLFKYQRGKCYEHMAECAQFRDDPFTDITETPLE